MRYKAENRLELIYSLGPFFSLLGLTVILSLLSDRFLTVNNLFNVARQVSVDSIVACGMTFVILTGGIDLSVGSVLALTGSLVAGLMTQGFSISVAIATGLILGMVLGYFNGLIVTRGKVAPFIATLVMMTMARGLTLVYTDGRPITGLPREFLQIGGGYLGPVPLPVIIMLSVFLLSHIVLTQTKFGRYVYAIGSNEEAARFSGIDTSRYKNLVYLISGALAALSGIILTSRLNSAQPTAGLGLELDAIAAVVLGGTSLAGGQGGIPGTLIGALIIGILNNGLNLLNVSSFYQQVVKGAVILLAVLGDQGRKKREG
ncbi:ribose ABC transporter membrane protein [Thermanaeromonas toyohensis ToBE]|uniref:Ribose ABC transporter membrane protein n=1 Tax=Thermanaeromonas toyohensis ToBE TaxID=698762 RepID=A0A1W1VKJ8_9FIRM|nr:hypothetical protein [Thermanaeromonas toyohensis]SMB93474.1 ribose ABC transporter membrane protein [Thermanaeromonas toyohensis ToBE]